MQNAPWYKKTKELFWEHAPIFFILCIALVLRLINIGAEPYWGDEILGVSIAKHFTNLTDLVRYISLVEIHPPLFYITLFYWIIWFGTNEAATRMLSVVFSMGIVVLTYGLGQKFFNRRSTALVAAFLVAILPLQIEMGTDARPYTLFGFFNLLSVWGYWSYRETAKARHLLLYVIGAVVSMYFHYSGILVTASLSLIWFGDVTQRYRGAERHREYVRWFVVQAGVACAFVPWLPFMLSKIMRQQATPIFGISGGDAYWMRSFRTLSTLQHLVWTTKESIGSIFEILAIWLAKGAVAFGLGIGVYRYAKGLLVISSKEARALIYIASLFGIGMILYLFYPASVPYTDLVERHVFILTVFLALLLAYLFTNLPRPYVLPIALLFCVSLTTFVANIVGDDGLWDIQHRLKATTEFINDNYQEGDLILIENAFLRTDFNYYLRPDLEAVAFYPPQYDGHDLYNTRETLGMIENDFQFRILALPGSQLYPKFGRLMNQYQPRRVWVAYFPDPFADIWFTSHGWRKQFSSPSKLLPLSLFVPIEPKNTTPQ